VPAAALAVARPFPLCRRMLHRPVPLPPCELPRPRTGVCRERLRQLPDAANITIAYPDEGAWKRFHYQFGDYPEVCLCGVLWRSNERGRAAAVHG
jgi:hypothetical protein